ncbi:MAG: DUF1330 domain-containing protein [Deltaproteobacteria bacterium HGW-Deltaproteobacteria-19]|jgi:uncharacterized protein (DUF1330 family)|nr:MAG: DUF1330 domain-containing protein [Deltaproteobacteria bacterium HGW-Deltaproteobacteria-19]
MAAYVVVQVEVTDWDRFREYLKETPIVSARYGGKYIARGGESVVLEGEEPLRRVVIIEFPSLQKAKEWYHSKEYQQTKKLREGAAKGLLIAIEGC